MMHANQEQLAKNWKESATSFQAKLIANYNHNQGILENKAASDHVKQKQHKAAKDQLFESEKPQKPCNASASISHKLYNTIDHTRHALNKNEINQISTGSQVVSSVGQDQQHKLSE